MVENQKLKDLLRQTAIADISINDLGVTLNNWMFDLPCEPSYILDNNASETTNLNPFIKFVDAETMNEINFRKFVDITGYLCVLIKGVDLAKQLVKKSGLMGYKLSGLINHKIPYTETLTEEFIETMLEYQLKRFSSGNKIEIDLLMSARYKDTFEQYCSKNMSKEQLEKRIKSKIKTYCKR